MSSTSDGPEQEGQSGPPVQGGPPPRGRFTIVYLIHEAFRRDLIRLQRAVRAPSTDAAKASRLRAHWDFVHEQLHHHHRVEDDSLWPLVRPKLAGHAEELEVLNEMEAQHHTLEPKCQVVIDGFASFTRLPHVEEGNELAERIEDLKVMLGNHLDDEEVRAFPVIDEALTSEEFESFGKATAKAIGMRGSARFFPWIFDDANPVERSAVLQMPPPPVRIMCRYLWEPAYQRKVTPLWASP